MNIIKNFLLALILVVSIFPDSDAQTKRALLIGIDEYQPQSKEVADNRGGWTNLDGCVNDAIAIQDIIVSRFGFEKQNISTLHNQQAKRDQIIAAIEKLIEISEKGDVVFIYYAGHGSQVYNSLSTEESGDKKDESIVPADMFDIRDKEMAALYNKLLDNGVILTLIFDSCHSGSIARGNNLPVTFKERHINGSGIDAKDPSNPQKPEDRGALILSAAQPEQLAKEALDDNGNPHGAFTVALIKALNTAAPGEPVEVLFLRIKAIMQANGSTQEPVLGSNENRRKQGLFGEDLSENSGKTIVAVLNASGVDNISLQGGYAIGLNAGCELLKINGTEKIVITTMAGMSKSQAKLISGEIANIKPGDLFEVITWAAPNQPNLKIWFPDYGSGFAELLKTAEELGKIQNNKSYRWISDPTITAPDYIIQYYNKKWQITGPKSEVIILGDKPTADQVMKKIPKNSSVYLQLPPCQELVKQIILGENSPNNAIAITSDPAAANYILAGNYFNNTISFAFVKPNITEADTSLQNSAPLKTEWIAIKSPEDFKTAGTKLTDFALKLGRINAWLNLNNPPDDGSFPFSLALKNVKTGEYLNSGNVYGGEQYSLVMVTDKERLKKWSGKSRYVYVFAIDINGKTQQIFPYVNTGNEGNKLPGKAYDFETEVALGQITFTIGKPWGIDTYFMVTSDEAINNFQAFNCDGVTGISHTRGGSQLDQLLNTVGSASRGFSTNPTPLNWSVEKIFIRSKEK